MYLILTQIPCQERDFFPVMLCLFTGCLIMSAWSAWTDFMSVHIFRQILINLLSYGQILLFFFLLVVQFDFTFLENVFCLRSKAIYYSIKLLGNLVVSHWYICSTNKLSKNSFLDSKHSDEWPLRNTINTLLDT